MQLNRHSLLAFLALWLGAGSVCWAQDGTYGDDVQFLKKHTDAVELIGDDGKARVAVVGKYQGRVMTSTARGATGDSYGWINHSAVASKEIQPHMNAYGGEDRFWMGPEGGQFAIFFRSGDPFDLEHWQTPAVIDTQAYELVSNSTIEAVYRQEAKLKNFSDAQFNLRIDRAVRLLNRQSVGKALGGDVPSGVDLVAYESVNKLTNKGPNDWNSKSGLLSIWILGMYKHSAQTTVVIPFVAGDAQQLGVKVNDTYFGKVPADRLVVRDDILFFRGDGQYRSKIGINPARAREILGSYDAARDLLTIVTYTKPAGATKYVNSMWELQDEPFAGDAVNSYNDGPPEPGKKPLGPFYELETSSPALELPAGESATHVHRTVHFQGSRSGLDKLAKRALGVSLSEIVSAFQ